MLHMLFDEFWPIRIFANSNTSICGQHWPKLKSCKPRGKISSILATTTSPPPKKLITHTTQARNTQILRRVVRLGERVRVRGSPSSSAFRYETRGRHRPWYMILVFRCSLGEVVLKERCNGFEQLNFLGAVDYSLQWSPSILLILLIPPSCNSDNKIANCKRETVKGGD